MTEKTYRTTLLIRGDSKDAVRQVNLTREELERLTGAQAEGSKASDVWSQRFSRASEVASKYAGVMKIAGGAIVAASGTIAAMVVQTASAAREIDNLSRLSGTSVERFQEMAYAGERYGIQQDKLADILKDTQDKIGDFLQTGGGAMADFFENIAPKVGVTAQQFARLSGPEALQLFVSSLEKANLSQAEMTFHMEALASDSTLLLPLLRDNGREMGALTSEAQRLGVAMSEVEIEQFKEFGGELDSLKAQFQGLGREAATALLPSLRSVTDELRDPETHQALADLARGTGTLAGMFLELSVSAANAGKELAKYTPAHAVGKGVAWLISQARGIGIVRDELDRLGEELVKTIDIDPIVAGARVRLRALQSTYADLDEQMRSLQGTQESAAEAAERLKEEQKAQEKAAKEAARAQLEYQKNLRSVLDSVYPLEAATRKLRDEYNLLARAVASGDAAGSDLHAWIDANLQIEVTAKRVTKEMKLLKDEADPLAAAYERGLERMDDGFADFFKGVLRDGKVTFDSLKNIFLDTLGEMIYAAARNRIMVGVGIGGGAAGAAASTGVAGTGVPPTLSSLFGSSVSGLYQGIGTGLSNLGATGLGDMAYNAGLRYSGIGGAAMGIGGGLVGGMLGNRVFGSTSGVGAALGGIAGGMLIPIPGVGTAIGSFLGSGLESLIGGKPSDQRQYASGGFSVADQILSGFDGKKFSQENQDAAAALLAQIQQMGMAIGGTSAAGSVSVGGRTGMRLSTGQGEGSFRTFTSAEELLDAAFREILDGATSLAPAVKTLARAFEGGREQAIAYTQSLQGLWEQTKINPVDQAMRDIASQQGTLFSSYQKQIGGLRDLIGEYDGSLGSTQQLSQALSISQQSAYQLTATIRGLSQEMGAMFESSAKTIRESVMSEEERFRSWINQRDALRASLDTLVDPQKIAEAGREIERLNTMAFNALPNANAEVAESYARVAEAAGREVERQLRVAENQIRDQSSAINQEIRKAMGDVAAEQQRAAEGQKQAAQLQLQAAGMFQSVISQLQARGIPIQTISSETV